MDSSKKPINRFTGLMQVIRQESSQSEPLNQETEFTTVIAPIEQFAESWLPLKKIHPDPEQSRRYFDPDELKNMATSMKAVGVIDPLSVRPRPRTVDEYDLLAGEKRHRSAEIAGLERVPVRVFAVDDHVAEDIKAISNLQRGDLNKWEETNAIMGMLCRNLGKSQEEVVSLLNQAANQKRGLTDNVVRKEDWEIVEEVFTLVGRMTPESFRKHRIPLMKLPNPIQVVLQQGKLHYTKVNEILKVKNLEQQSKLLEEALYHNLSVDEIQAKVKALRQEAVQSAPMKTMDISKRLLTIPRQLKQAKVWQDPEKQMKLEVLLDELERLLN